MAPEAPAEDSAAGHVARAKHNVGPRLDRLEDLRNVARIMREIRVHLESHVVAALERKTKTLDVRGAEPELRRAMQHMNAPVTRRYRIRELSCPVRRCVVHDEHIRARYDVEDRAEERSEVVALVVCGRDDERGGHPSAQA